MGHVRPRLSAALARPGEWRRAHGHRRRAQRAIDPIAVAAGEQMQNRIMYKQYLQAGSFKVMQIDATRVAGPQESVLEYLLANKFGVRVCHPTPAVSACARRCVTSPCSITWRSVDNGMIASSNMWTTSTNTSCIPLRSSMVVTGPDRSGLGRRHETRSRRTVPVQGLIAAPRCRGSHGREHNKGH